MLSFLLNHHYPYPDDRIYEDRKRSVERWLATRFPHDYQGEELQMRAELEWKKYFELAASAFIGQKPQQEAAEHLQHSALFAHIHFAATVKAGQPLSFTFKGKELAITGRKWVPNTMVGDWHLALCKAITLRNKKAIDDLCLYESRDYTHDLAEDLPIEFAYCDFIKGLYNPKADLKALLAEYMHYSGPEFVPERRQPYIYYIWLPFVEMLLAVLANDETRYQQAFQQALEGNQKRFAVKNKQHIAQGWLPMHICAAAALAYDQCGFKLPTTSPYIPEWLVYGEFERI